ncbi:MAG: hypothetical protein ABI831_22550, partial [Betaproteobacteria bacterium]
MPSPEVEPPGWAEPPPLLAGTVRAAADGVATQETPPQRSASASAFAFVAAASASRGHDAEPAPAVAGPTPPGPLRVSATIDPTPVATDAEG